MSLAEPGVLNETQKLVSLAAWF